jgi:hypothetical protein
LVHCPFWTAKEVEGIVAKHKEGSSYLDVTEKEKRFQNEGCNFAKLWGNKWGDFFKRPSTNRVSLSD